MTGGGAAFVTMGAMSAAEAGGMPDAAVSPPAAKVVKTSFRIIVFSPQSLAHANVRPSEDDPGQGA
jgi:hypothetical protein